MRLATTFALAGLALALAPAAAVAAATHGVTTSNVNFRSGPDTAFPAVTVIPGGSPVVILGCLEDRSWCDVIFYGERGWVHAAYLQGQAGGGYWGGRAPEPVYAAPVVGFNVDLYWNEHYRGRSWYRDRDRFHGPSWRNRRGWDGPGWNGHGRPNNWQQPTYNSRNQNDRDRQGWNGNGKGGQQRNGNGQQWNGNGQGGQQWPQGAPSGGGNRANGGGGSQAQLGAGNDVIYFDTQTNNAGRGGNGRNGGSGGNSGSTNWRGNPGNAQGQEIRDCLDSGRSWDECRPDR